VVDARSKVTNRAAAKLTITYAVMPAPISWSAPESQALQTRSTLVMAYAARARMRAERARWKAMLNAAATAITMCKANSQICQRRSGSALWLVSRLRSRTSSATCTSSTNQEKRRMRWLAAAASSP
jgi:hypothetical protein